MTRPALLTLFLVLAAAACTPVVRPAGAPVLTPAYTKDALVMADGTRLALRSWLPEGKPRVVIVALHGFDDYSEAFTMPGKVWAGLGIATYAYDQRGFGTSKDAHFWPGTATLVADAREAVRLIARRHPGVPVVLLGESMGGGVAMLAIAHKPPPELSAAVLVAPAVWGLNTMPWSYRASLWLVAHVAPWLKLSGAHLDIWPSDNIPMLRALSADPLVIKETRVDVIYGLVHLMDRALAAAGPVPVPVLVAYGEKDQIVPKAPMRDFVDHLSGPVHVAVYANGYHMLLRDLDRWIPTFDIAHFVLDPDAPLPSDAEARARRFFAAPSS